MHPGLPALRASTARLDPTLATLDDAAVTAPSTLPGWNRAMVLTHLARNADAFRRVAEGATRGEVTAIYPDGPAGRDADIAAGASRGAAALVEDVRTSAALLGEALSALTAEAWEQSGLATRGRFAVQEIPLRRRREVEVHHVDLALAYSATDWPDDFVDAELATAVGDLPERLEAAAGAGTGLRLVASDGAGAVAGSWAVGAPDATLDVRGPRCELLAWLLGRPHTLADPPQIGAWR